MVCETLVAGVSTIPRRVILQCRAGAGVLHQPIVIEAVRLIEPAPLITAPANPMRGVAKLIVTAILRVWPVHSIPRLDADMRSRFFTRVCRHQSAYVIVLIRSVERGIDRVLCVSHAAIVFVG